MTREKNTAKKVYYKPIIAKKEQSHVYSSVCGHEGGRCGDLVKYY